MTGRAAAAALLLVAAACGDGPTVRRGGTGSDVGEACARGADCKSSYCFERRCATAMPAAATCTPPGNPSIVLGSPNPIGPAEPPSGPADPPCARPVQPVAGGFAGAVQSLGAHRVGTELTFDVAPGATSLTLVLQEVDGSAADVVLLGVEPNTFALPNAPSPRTVHPPGSQAPFFDLFATPLDDASGRLAEYVGFLAGSASVTFPNTSQALDLFRSAGEVPPGTWRLALTDDAASCARFGCASADTSGIYDVKILTRGGPYRGTATLDLDVYFVSTQAGLTAMDAVADPATNATARHFRRFVSELSRIFARAGVCLGTVRVHDLPAWAVEAFHDLDLDADGPCSPLARLFTLSADSNAVHLFLVDALITGGGTQGSIIVGIDGTIPGPSGLPGTVNSGAAVVLSDFGHEAAAGACAGPTNLRSCGTDVVAHIAAHEAGHWLGLYHTTEASGLVFDPLSDTDKCACASCAPPAQRGACSSGRGVVPASSCGGTSCGGGRNLMFWQVSPGVSAGLLTPHQGEVIRANPATR